MSTYRAISSIYAKGRTLQTLNDSSPQINLVKDQLVALDLQVRDMERHVKHLRYLIRSAKSSRDYGTVREIERQLFLEKHQLKVLKNHRNGLFNRLTDKLEFWSRWYAPKVCEKTVRNRALRLQRDAQSQV